MKRSTKNKYPVKESLAKLIKKENSSHYDFFGKLPIKKDVYELLFEVEDEKLIFEVSIFEYNVLEEGMEGNLQYQGYELLSFGDWIKKRD